MDGAAVDSIAVTLELQKGFVHLPDAVCNDDILPSRGRRSDV